MRVRPSVPVKALVRLARRAMARLQEPSEAPSSSTSTPVAPATPARFEARRATMSPGDQRALDPITHAQDFRQPDQTSCGASSLVVSRMIHDRPYAMWLITGYDPRTDREDVSAASERWRAEVLAVHRRVTGLRDRDGDLQWPWLRAVGTSPWGAARQMTGDGGAGVPGARYRARTLDPDDLMAEFDRIVAAVEAGHTVPLYVGNDVRPAHVVLVVGVRAGRLDVYEPSAGRMVRIARDAFCAGRFSVGGWSVPWFAVLPR